MHPKDYSYTLIGNAMLRVNTKDPKQTFKSLCRYFIEKTINRISENRSAIGFPALSIPDRFMKIKGNYCIHFDDFDTVICCSADTVPQRWHVLTKYRLSDECIADLAMSEILHYCQFALDESEYNLVEWESIFVRSDPNGPAFPTEEIFIKLKHIRDDKRANRNSIPGEIFFPYKHIEKIRSIFPFGFYKEGQNLYEHDLCGTIQLTERTSIEFVSREMCESVFVGELLQHETTRRILSKNKGSQSIKEQRSLALDGCKIEGLDPQPMMSFFDVGYFNFAPRKGKSEKNTQRNNKAINSMQQEKDALALKAARYEKRIAELEQKLDKNNAELLAAKKSCEKPSQKKELKKKEDSRTGQFREMEKTLRYLKQENEKIRKINEHLMNCRNRPQRMEKIPEWIKTTFEGRIELHERAVRMLSKGENSAISIDILCDALEYLAQEYLDVLQGKISPDEANKICAYKYQRPFRVIPTGSAYRTYSDYNIVIDKINHFLDLHLTWGVNVENLIRIYFFYDKNVKKIIIGSLPRHLPVLTINA